MTDQALKGSETPSAPCEEGRLRAVSRSNCYGLLALVFRNAPTPELVARLRSPPLAETLGGLGYDVAKDLAGELDEATERLAEQYTHVFVGPGPHVAPYASVHCDGEGGLWADSTVQVKRFIEATGLSFQGKWDSIPDHISIELELMQRLAEYEATLWDQAVSDQERGSANCEEQLRQCRQIQERFLRDHLCKWIHRFAERVGGRPEGGFYLQMAELTESIVSFDLESLSEAGDVFQA